MYWHLNIHSWIFEPKFVFKAATPSYLYPRGGMALAHSTTTGYRMYLRKVKVPSMKSILTMETVE